MGSQRTDSGSTDVALKRIAQARQVCTLPLVAHVAETLLKGLVLLEARQREPIVFRMDPEPGWWLVGVGEDASRVYVPPGVRGMLPAWHACAYGSADLREFSFDDVEQDAPTSIRHSIRGACADAVARACPELAAVFKYQLTVDKARVQRQGTRTFDCGR